jgi:NADP-dependent 3-hydroxy acid dehydrogenase YdfG
MKAVRSLKGEVAVVTGAASGIGRGIMCGDTRVLIGSDAKQLDWIQRHFPERHWRIIGPMMTRRAGRALF